MMTLYGTTPLGQPPLGQPLMGHPPMGYPLMGNPLTSYGKPSRMCASTSSFDWYTMQRSVLLSA